jgi:hypothetical protein
VRLAILGRPVARKLEDGFIAEVRRVCTDGTPNACSMLLRAAWRTAKALGYRNVITYTLREEGGASLRAAGFTLVTERAGGGRWNGPGRPATDTHPLGYKCRWGCGREQSESTRSPSKGVSTPAREGLAGAGSV